MHWLAALERVTGIPVAFMSTTANPLHRPPSKQTTCPPTYSEYPHVIEAFNQLAASVAKKHNLAYFNTYAISRDLLELSFDGTHYADPVARALAKETERWLESVLPPPRS